MMDPYTHVVLLTHIGARSAENVYPFFTEDDANQFVTLMGGTTPDIMLDVYELTSPVQPLDAVADWHGDVEVRDRAERFIDYLQSRSQA